MVLIRFVASDFAFLRGTPSSASFGMCVDFFPSYSAVFPWRRCAQLLLETLCVVGTVEYTLLLR